MFPYIILMALAPAVIMAQTRGNTYSGCLTRAPGQGFPGSSTPPTTFAASTGQCADACVAENMGYTYAYFRTGDQTCLCSSASPPSYAVTAGSQTCPTTSFTAFRLATTFSFFGCGSIEGTTGLEPSFAINTMPNCFSACRFTLGAIISATGDAANQPLSEYQCRCRSGRISFRSETCGPGAERFFVFSHPQSAASGGLTRRGAKTWNSEEEKLCPAGLTACRVQGSEDGYECIDTMSELESCGGCVFGRYGTRKRGIKGVNCAILDSYDFGGTTCEAGRCVDAF